GRGEDLGELVGADVLHQQVAAQVEHAAAGNAIERNVPGAEFGVGAEDVNEAAVLPRPVDDHRLAGLGRVAVPDQRDVHARFPQQSGDDTTEDIAADAADHGGRDTHLGEIDGGVGRTAADGQEHAVGHDELAGGGQMGDRRADMVGNHDAGAKDIGT